MITEDPLPDSGVSGPHHGAGLYPQWPL